MTGLTQVKGAVSTQAHQAAGTMKGVAHSVTPHRHEEMDDVTLADRVRSEIFRDAHAPKSSVSVDVQAGVAYLRGEVADQAWIERFGFGKKTGINFPGESRGILPSYWSGSTIGTLPIGHGRARDSARPRAAAAVA